ncbi:MAG: hypothetical protein V2I66_06340 [Halieaceae bacterium]|jgi:hypothetical protein|nr:hypothetical protein [Halieaceae bacterium]
MIEHRWLWVAALLCLLLYLPGLFGPFTFDSVIALVRNPALGADPGSFQAWLVALDSSSAGPTGRPVSMLSFALSHGLIGHSALLEKSVNLVIHMLAALVLYQWLRLLLRTPALGWSEEQAGQGALAAGLLWLLNPMQLSTVLYSVQRMEQLSALFTLLALYLYTRHRSRWLEQTASAVELSRTLFLLVLLTLAAVLSKEDGILLLPLLALMEALLFRGRYAGRRLPWLQWLAGIACLAPLVGVALVALAEPAWLQQRSSWRGIASDERLLTQARVLWHYVSLFYWPDIGRMSLFHDDIAISRGWLQPWTTATAVAGWLTLVAVSLATVKRQPLFAFCVGFFLITHAIESSVIPLDLAYEHRSYLGNAALALLPVFLLYPRVPAASRPVVLAIVLLPLCVALGLRSVQWGNELRLYEAQLRHHPQSEHTVYYYANLRMRLADEVEDLAASQQHVLAARRYFEYLLELDPHHLPALVSLLYVDSRWFPAMSREPTLEALQRAAEERVMEPSDGNALEFLNRCLLAGYCEIPEERLLAMVSALRSRYPDNPAYPAFLARYYGEVRGDLARAIMLSREAIDSRPTHPTGYYQLASWYLAQGHKAGAAAVLGELLEQDGDLAALRSAGQVLP